MEIPALNELIDSLDETNLEQAPVKAILLALRGAMLVNRQKALLDHLIPWVKDDRDRSRKEIHALRASLN